MGRDWNSSVKTVITNNQTWYNNRTIFGSLVIPAGKTLTINATVKFSSNSRIIVERGGKLIVDGGKLTSADNGTWRGIEVWGTTSLSQSAVNNGLVTLNNATIENAETGIILAKRYRSISIINPPTIITCTAEEISIQPPPSSLIIDANYSGGKIIATNSRFINNKIAVEFYPYNKTNYSSFTRCTFEINKSIQANNMVYISGTNGVKFNGSNFIVANGLETANLRGIYAYNSSLSIAPHAITQTDQYTLLLNVQPQHTAVLKILNMPFISQVTAETYHHQ